MKDEMDYMYIDSPYFPEKKTSFVGYTENGFSIKQHHELFEYIHKMTKERKRCMMSNADVEDVRTAFSNADVYSIESFVCKRKINAKNPNAKTNEIMVMNYSRIE
jgi:DNA adenine methylase